MIPPDAAAVDDCDIIPRSPSIPAELITIPLRLFKSGLLRAINPTDNRVTLNVPTRLV